VFLHKLPISVCRSQDCFLRVKKSPQHPPWTLRRLFTAVPLNLRNLFHHLIGSIKPFALTRLQRVQSTQANAYSVYRLGSDSHTDHPEYQLSAKCWLSVKRQDHDLLRHCLYNRNHNPTPKTCQHFFSCCHIFLFTERFVGV